MKIKSILKNNKLLIAVILTYIVLLIISPEIFLKAADNSLYYLIEMIQILPVVFLLTIIIDVMIPKNVIMKGLGKDSGVKGYMFALLLGSLSAGPIYAAFPISKVLLKKGASISNIVIILSAWAVVKVPMLANEAKFLGVEYMAVRWALTVTAIFLMAFITGIFVKKKDMPKYKTSNDCCSSQEIIINTDYCIGCGICANTLSEYYKIEQKKAIVLSDIKSEEDRIKNLGVIEKCPVNAISMNKKEKDDE
ncbi:MAG: permease [Christensenellales bacterium]|jgi:uncharacterized membrane protein YraQ (UPF0718 family)